MAIKRVQKKIAWSEDDKRRHEAIRESFKDKPTVEELIGRGELSGQPMSLAAYVSLRLLVRSLRTMREQANLSLADLAQKSGMDKAMLSRLENGHVANPGIATISRYVSALNKEIEWRIVEAVENSRP